jgi:hypothetical protein
MKEGTQNMMSLPVAFAARKRFSGVGMVGGDLGSKALNTNPDEAYEKDQRIILQPRDINSPPKTSEGYPFLNVHMGMSSHEESTVEQTMIHGHAVKGENLAR